MALGSGITVMGKNTDLDANQIGAEQALANQLLMRALQNPQVPEKSWTQGAARMAEMLVSAYKSNQAQKKQDSYNLDRQKSMGGLATALATGNPQAIAAAISGIKDPQSQMMGMNQMAAMTNANLAQQHNLQNKGVDQTFTRENKGIDYASHLGEEQNKGGIQSDLSNQNAQQDIIKKNAEIQGESGRDVNKIQAETAGKLEENAKARTQNRMLDLNNVINDPNAPSPLKDLAAKELTTLGPLNQQMAHPQGVANTNTSLMTGNGVSGASGAAGGTGNGKGGAGAAPDIQSLATKARDNNAQINNVLRNIQTGVLNDQNTSEAGRQAIHLASTAGVPGAARTESAVKEFEQVSAQAGLGGLKDFISGTGGSRMPKTLIDMVQQATMDKNDNVSGAAPKLFLQKQINDRVIGLGGLEQEWINKNGAINYPDKTTGYNWEQANNAYMTHNPIVTKDDYDKNIQNKMGSPEAAPSQPNPSETQGPSLPPQAAQPQDMQPPAPQSQPKYGPEDVGVMQPSPMQNPNSPPAQGQIPAPSPAPGMDLPPQQKAPDMAQMLQNFPPPVVPQGQNDGAMLASLLAKKQDPNQFVMPTDSNDFTKFYGAGGY